MMEDGGIVFQSGTKWLLKIDKTKDGARFIFNHEDNPNAFPSDFAKSFCKILCEMGYLDKIYKGYIENKRNLDDK